MPRTLVVTNDFPPCQGGRRPRLSRVPRGERRQRRHPAGGQRLGRRLTAVAPILPRRHERKRTPCPPPHTPLDFDPDALRARYRAERDRRIRPDGNRQYRRTTGEFGHFDEDPHAEPGFTREPLTDHVDVVVVGGGFGGLLTGARLRQAGVRGIRIIEKGADFGGTWYWNRYPGIHCDIESYVYMPLLEELGYVPKWKYAPGEEIREHAQAIARHFDLYRDACFRTQATELRWDEDESAWAVTTDRGDRMTARHVVVATGCSASPNSPASKASRPSRATCSTPAAGTTTTPAATRTAA
ncbi:hypothetical protein GCM10010383_50560 [Streptomyces lomondensis]|uniref:Monooxygenase n=1 Tax=Streptomyces lomondensis TaxID=68229 RepID=A0ABQ2XFP7_9ACTN|nr:hypothetical protein GCM10010383_50560 [Streptomyces lomondensis]